VGYFVFDFISSVEQGTIMNAKFMYRMFVLVLGAALSLPIAFVSAGIVTTDELMASSQTDMEKAKVQEFFDRTEVKDRLQSLGVDAPSAADRVAAMTNQEVHTMALEIDAMPVGGDLSNNTLLIIAVILLLIIAL
jgi:hypothetical protein